MSRPSRFVKVDRDALATRIAALVVQARSGAADSTAASPTDLAYAAIESSMDLLPIEGRREVTILLSDLRGFTAMAERHPAEQLVATLDRYLAAMSRIIIDHGGLIDKFMGDAIMALFGVSPAPDHAVEAAVACAVEMQLAMDEVNRANAAAGMEPLYMGIGLNTGPVFVCHLGSEQHREYTAIGDEVNLASRIEAHSLRGQVLLSENTWRQVRSHVEIAEINEVQMKGRKDVVRLYEVVATHWPRTLRVPVREVRRSPRVHVDLPVIFHHIEGKSVCPQRCIGRACDLGYGGLRLLTSAAIEPHTDVQVLLNLSPADVDVVEICCKVRRVEKRPDGQWLAGLEFTAIEPSGRDAVKRIVDATLQAGAHMALSAAGIGANVRAVDLPTTTPVA